MESEKRAQSTRMSVGSWTLNKLIGGIVVVVVGGLILAMTGWNFSMTAAAPAKYADKAENKKDHNAINEKIDTKQQQVLDEIKEVQRLILKLHAK